MSSDLFPRHGWCLPVVTGLVLGRLDLAPRGQDACPGHSDFRALEQLPFGLAGFLCPHNLLTGLVPSLAPAPS